MGHAGLVTGILLPVQEGQVGLTRTIYLPRFYFIFNYIIKFFVKYDYKTFIILEGLMT